MMDMLSKVKVDAATFRIAALATAVLLLLLTARAASAATITVDDSGGADYTTIQAAVDNANAGGSISLDLQNVEFSDADFNLYTPAVVVDGQITVGIKGDFNGNGRVDIGDVAKVAFMVAEKVSKDLNPDFNENGRVDIGDVAKISFYLTGKVSEL